MALKYNKQKNLVRSPDEFTKYYGNFRGVDFSSDHTEVHDQRLAYCINMYKDYRTGEGNAIETIPGYRRRFEAPRDLADDGKVTYYPINGIHEYTYVKADGTRDKDIIVHAGNYLYLWDNYPYTVNVIKTKTTSLAFEKDDDGNDTNVIAPVIMEYPCERIAYVTVDNLDDSAPPDLSSGYMLYEPGPDTNNRNLTFDTDTYAQYVGKYIAINYYEKVLTKSEAIYNDANNHESKSFTFNNRLYIIDGANYLVCEKQANGTFLVERVFNHGNTYIPTTYANIGVGDAAPEDINKNEYEQMNLLCTRYYHTYIPDNSTTEYPKYSNDKVVGADFFINGKWEQRFVGDQDAKISFYLDAGTTTQATPTQDPSNPVNLASVRVLYERQNSASITSSEIDKCTILATFDKRVFLTGNPEFPNRIWYCGYNNIVGREDATYFGEIDYVEDGVENAAPVTGLIAVADTLAALKNYAKQDASVYFHTRLETNESLAPVTYPAQPGLSGIGCLGACTNFLDDPVFISRLGVEAIGQLSVRLERSIEHRSSLVDAKLVNMNLPNARIAEWDGYLVVLIEGKAFLADSRQKYAHDTGVAQYEWYYLEDIGIYEGQEKQYYYSPSIYDFITDKEITASYYVDEGKGIELKTGTFEIDVATNVYDTTYMMGMNMLNSPVVADDYEITAGLDLPLMIRRSYTDENGEIYPIYFVIRRTWDGQTYKDGAPDIKVKALVCDYFGSFTGGTYFPAKNVFTIEEDVAENTTASTNEKITKNTAANIFFGTDNGIVCSFNFDLKNKDGTISPVQYSFDNRTIYCGIATKMDNCGIPHLTKSTIKKSTVIKTKSMSSSAAKVRVRTNNKGYESVARVNSRILGFDNLDFSDFSFVAQDETIFAIKEKEKHWVEKQHWIYSDEYQRPFSVHYLAFRYKVSGRIK